jgi:hypothetical protein
MKPKKASKTMAAEEVCEPFDPLQHSEVMAELFEENKAYFEETLLEILHKKGFMKDRI